MKNRLVHLFLTILVFLYIIFEELIWETIAKPIYNYIHSLKLLQKIEAKIHHLHPWILLFFFLAIFIVVEIVGILAGILALQGNIFVAAMLYISKIPVAAFAFWLFRVSQDKLLSIRWFNTIYGFVMQKIDWIKQSNIYHTIKEQAAIVKNSIKSFKNKYFPKGEFKRYIKRIYLQLKKIFKKDTS